MLVYGEMMVARHAFAVLTVELYGDAVELWLRLRGNVAPVQATCAQATQLRENSTSANRIFERRGG